MSIETQISKDPRTLSNVYGAELDPMYTTAKGGPTTGKNKVIGEYDYRGVFSPGKEVLTDTELFFDTSQKNKIFSLSDYRWYPENFTNMLNTDDLYNTVHELINDIPEIGTGPIGMIVAGLKSSTTRISKFFGKKKDTIASHNLDSHHDDDGLDPTERMFRSIPYIKITEFQPQQEIKSFLGNMKVIWDVLGSLFDSKKSGGDASIMDKIKGVFGTEGLKSIIADVLELDQDEPDHIKNVIRIPNFFYQNMIGGMFTSQYFVPLSHQETYLNASGSSGWSSRSIKQQFFGNMLSGLIDKIPGIGQFDIAGRPKFSLEGNNPLPDTVTTTFHLFNYNMDALILNLKFIYAITSGAYWLQSGFMQVSSNLYDIEVPGRFRYYFCKANIRVDYAGKVRTLRKDTRESLETFFTKVQNTGPHGVFSKAPDAFKVTIEFLPLLPNNFNTHINYFIGDNDVHVGKYVDEKTQKVGKAVLSRINEIVKEQDQSTTNPTDIKVE